MTTRFGLWLASGESGAEGEEERIANRSRSATPLPSRRRKPAAFAAHARLPLVTSARFAERNGRGREGEGADRQPVERSKAARWSRRLTGLRACYGPLGTVVNTHVGDRDYQSHTVG